MKEHPINDLLKISLENIGDLVDVNKVIGEPIILDNEITAIPVSKVVCGYGVGGAELSKNKKYDIETSKELFPFGGASGGGLTITLQALILIKKDDISLVRIEKDNDIAIKAINTIKDIFKK